ncbi:LpxI family protein [Mesobacterium pallidum]|uniref:LpxI family protein n=1 Tax=Mesobacterium pallidum TaxID=2872037 RepID=UPI001EE15604|nr:UDP-2,3-diacylglucosamine diphosphatase LpxI [Mesobacterium pallidum]
MTDLALIAGRGRLPERVAAQVTPAPLVCALEGNAPDRLSVDLTFRLETLGTFLLELGTRGISRICMCGSIDRPQIDPSKLDAETAPLVPLLQEALGQGDDGALRAVIGLFEQTGFTVLGAESFAPKVVADIGYPTRREPRTAHRIDAETGEQTVAAMGASDTGQACVIRKGRVLAEEQADGTDAMLARLGPLPTPPETGAWDEWLFDGDSLTEAGRAWAAQVVEAGFDAKGLGGILYKGPKPGQETRADRPTIGPRTALSAAAAGMDGIVLGQGSIIIDQARLVALLDAMDMFLWVRR